jgi:hypothetical protein
MLSVSRLVQVTVNISPAGAIGRSFGTLMIAGDSNVISGLQRFVPVNSIEAVAALGYSSTAPEYLAAELYFSQVPQPSSAMMGRWLSAATSGFNLGEIQTPAAQAISTWTGITSGGFKIAIDGGSLTAVTSLNFSSVTNLNGVASVITTGLSGASLGAVCTWNGSAFQITSNSTGAGAAATGTITFTGNPAANDTVTIGGTAVTFVASSPVGNQVVIGSSSAITLANLLAFLQASNDSNIDECTYTSTGLVITLLYKVAGTGGNSFTLAKSSSALSVSGADLSGGTMPSSVGYAVAPASGTDISSLLGMTSATSQGLANGYASETPVQCVTALQSLSSQWYGIMFASTATVTTAQSLAVSSYVEALTLKRIYGVTTQDPNTLSALVMNDLASLMSGAGYNQSCIQYSSTSAYAIASMFGRAFTVDFTAQNSTIELMYKQEPGVTAENLQEGQADVLASKNCNVFASYDNSTSILQTGCMSSGTFFDEIHGLDWFQNAVQTAVYNVLYTAPTKIPQTDPGLNQFTNACASVCGSQPGGAVYNGLAAPGVWNSTATFGTLQTGQYLTQGFYVYAPSVNTQSESDRATRKAPPIQIALKLAGAFQTADVLVTVNQ